jgi:plastocyanin
MRQTIVNTAVSYLGCKESDGSHRKIIDIYNNNKPLARSYKVKYTDEWCATFVSAMAIKCGMTDIIPTECGCGEMIKLLQQKGSWQENDAHKPEPGDIMFYDWDDSGKGDNTGHPDHVGIVEKVSGSTITVIEGNYQNAVKRRTIAVNGITIRGYGVPKYKAISSGSNAGNSSNSDKSLTFKVGDTVEFTGSKHYVSSVAKKGSACKPGKATVTVVSKGSKHPYHLVRVKGGKSTVYGWVDECDVKKCESLTFKVGDTVEFTGSKHYVSPDAKTGPSCKPGKAKITAISPNNKHPYHLIKVNGGGSTVYGWVDADTLTK